MPHDTQATTSTSGTNNCLYDALACQTGLVKRGAELREKVANRIDKSTYTPILHDAVKILRAHNPAALREGGGTHMAALYMMRKDPHDFHNRLLLSSEKTYRNLEKERQKADQCGNAEKSQEITGKLRAMELAAFKARREQEAEVATYALQLGAGIGAAAATGGTGLLPYLAGTGAFAGVGIALDPVIHIHIKAGN